MAVVRGFQLGVTAFPPPKKKTPAAKFASQGDAHVRTDAQIKFRYYPLVIEYHLYASALLISPKSIIYSLLKYRRSIDICNHKYLTKFTCLEQSCQSV